jgi:Protein of unknown function (DUF2439)
MFTQQKTKKHKTWKDGCVIGCPTKFSLTLFKWSDTLGKTGAALAEVYLSQLEYEAFIGMAGASRAVNITCSLRTVTVYAMGMFASDQPKL